jgi:hypothetical protein
MLLSSSGGDSTSLPYVHSSSRGTPVADEIGDDDGLSLDIDQEYMRSRSPEEKRGGAVFEDLNLGLDLGDEDEEVRFRCQSYTLPLNSICSTTRMIQMINVEANIL